MLNAQYLFADNHMLVSHMEAVKYQTFSCKAVHRMKKENQRIRNSLKQRQWKYIMFLFNNASF